MKTYIRKKGTKRWLRFKSHDDLCRYMNKLYEPRDFYKWDDSHNLTTSVESYHQNNSDKESEVYEVTQDKQNIKTVKAEYYLEPQVMASIV